MRSLFGAIVNYKLKRNYGMISIDTVYQKVLALANKEQRGYITPQEFNLFADMAHKEIFEQYFYDKNQWIRQHGNETGYSDARTNLDEKIERFQIYNRVAYVSGNVGVVNFHASWNNNLDRIYRLGRVTVKYKLDGDFVIAEKVNHADLEREHNAGLLSGNSKKRPIYWQSLSSASDTGPLSDGDGWATENMIMLRIFPIPKASWDIIEETFVENPEDKVYLDYIQSPLSPEWGYTVVNEKALYNSNTSTQIDLHPSEESEMIYKILKFAGISLQKQNVTQAGQGLETVQVQQEKQ